MSLSGVMNFSSLYYLHTFARLAAANTLVLKEKKYFVFRLCTKGVHQFNLTVFLLLARKGGNASFKLVHSFAGAILPICWGGGHLPPGAAPVEEKGVAWRWLASCGGELCKWFSVCLLLAETAPK